MSNQYYNLNYKVYEEIARGFKLFVDTREQRRGRFFERMNGFRDNHEFLGTIERKKLNVGDYSAELTLPNGDTLDFTDMVAIERKMDLDELIRGFTSDRSRFQKELIRAQESNCKLIVVVESGCYNDILAGRYYRHASSKRVSGTYHAFMNRYNVNFEFVTAETFPAYVFNTLRRYIFDYLLKNYPNGEILKEPGFKTVT